MRTTTELPYVEPIMWMKDAVCAHLHTTDPQRCDTLFFPQRFDQQNVETAKLLCRSCPVYKDCFEYMLTLPKPIKSDTMIIAGLKPTEQKAARKQRAEAAA